MTIINKLWHRDASAAISLKWRLRLALLLSLLVGHPFVNCAHAAAIDYNPGLNGAWFNPQTPGQGFFVEVFPDSGAIFLAWFTWDTTEPDPATATQIGAAGQRWLTAQGTFEGGVAQLDVFLTEGGLFDDPQVVTNSPEGSITLQFDDCYNGTVEYDLVEGGVFGILPITRLANDNGAYCESFGKTVTTPNPDGTTTVNYPFSSFTEVSVGGPFNVTIDRGAVYSVEVTIDSDDAQFLDVSKFGTELDIGLESHNNLQIETMKVSIRMPHLTELSLAGATRGVISGFSGERFSTALAGAVNLQAFNVDFRHLSSQQAGACNLNFENAKPLSSANVILNGASTATLNMLDNASLSGKVTAASSVMYYGSNLDIDLFVDFTSTLTRLGNSRP